MTGKRIGYIRVSTVDQNIDRQLEGMQLDKTFVDRASGKDAHRPQLDAMLDFIREGDVVFVHSLDRLARNLMDLRKIVDRGIEKGVQIEFIKEGLRFSGENNAMSVFMLNVMGAFAEFERSLIRERQKEGIAIAKKKGLYKGRKPSLSPEQVLEVKKMLELGVAKAKVARNFRVSRETLYAHLRSPKISPRSNPRAAPKSSVI